MPAEPYTLDEFVTDLERITREEEAGRAITERVAPLLGRLVKNPESIPVEFRRRAGTAGADATSFIARRGST